MTGRDTDKLICGIGVLFMAGIAVFGFYIGNHEIAGFGATAFTGFSGPLFMAMNREMTNNGNGNGSGNSDPTKGH